VGSDNILGPADLDQSAGPNNVVVSDSLPPLGAVPLVYGGCTHIPIGCGVVEDDALGSAPNRKLAVKGQSWIDYLHDVPPL
jgi:hypothetical protein